MPKLTVTRKRDESIAIGNNILITIKNIKGGRARIIIEAPIEVPVYRTELLEQKKKGLAAGVKG
jgi:carbon storage regulator